MSQGKFRHFTVMAVVVANMVGTGVFTSLGFQLLDIRSGFVLLALWVVGGLAAVCGAMTYAELGAVFDKFKCCQSSLTLFLRLVHAYPLRVETIIHSGMDGLGGFSGAFRKVF